MSASQSKPSQKLKPLSLGRARWRGGFWGERFANCRDVMIPTMARLMQGEERVRFLGNFEVAAGAARRERDGFYDVNTGDGPRTQTDDQNQDFYTVRGQLLILPTAEAIKALRTRSGGTRCPFPRSPST